MASDKIMVFWKFYLLPSEHIWLIVDT